MRAPPLRRLRIELGLPTPVARDVDDPPGARLALFVMARSDMVDDVGDGVVVPRAGLDLLGAGLDSLMVG